MFSMFTAKPAKFIAENFFGMFPFILSEVIIFSLTGRAF
jgi:hypothetical protein